MLDWIAMILTALCIYMVGERNKWGWVIGLLSNFLWMIFSILTGQIPLLLTNIILAILNARAILIWFQNDTK